MIRSLSLVLLSIFGFSLIPTAIETAEATERVSTTRVVERTSCDQRDPIVDVTVSRNVRTIEFAEPGTDPGFFLLERDVESGTHRYKLPRQAYGTTREWVIVVTYGRTGFEHSRVLTFTRPAKADCVADQNPRLDAYRPGINTVCGEDSLTMYLVTVKVKPGTPGYILRPGVAELVQRNDQELHGEGYLVVSSDKRRAEYYVYAGRFSRLKLDPQENGAWPVRTSSGATQLVTSVYRTCQEQFENQ